MIIPDSNLLVYANAKDSPFYPKAVVWWENVLNGNEFIGLPWNVILGFIRLTTNPTIAKSGIDVDATLGVVDSWLQHPNVVVLNPGERHFEIMARILSSLKLGNNLVADAHLAALAIENRATLCSHDRDFQRFSGFRLFDPIAN